MNKVVNFWVKDVAIVPWSAVNLGTGRTKNNRKFRFASKNKRLQTFQDHVKELAEIAMNGKPACSTPVYLDLWISKKTENESLHGSWCYVPEGKAKNLRGDLTNLVKSIEDALQGVVYVNDALVCAGRQMVTWGACDAVQVKVFDILSLPAWTGHPTPLR